MTQPTIWEHYATLDKTRRQASRNQQTAEEAYDEREAEIETMIADFRDMMKKHGDAFRNSGSRDWGYVGDLGYYRNQLRETMIGSSFAPKYQEEEGE